MPAQAFVDFDDDPEGSLAAMRMNGQFLKARPVCRAPRAPRPFMLGVDAMRGHVRTSPDWIRRSRREMDRLPDRSTAAETGRLDGFRRLIALHSVKKATVCASPMHPRPREWAHSECVGRIAEKRRCSFQCMCLSHRDMSSFGVRP